MLGAIIGDVVGSRFEWNNIKTKEFELLVKPQCRFTDDTVMTLAICEALLQSTDDYADLGEQAVKWMQVYGRFFGSAGYGSAFMRWLITNKPKPYNSYGNGAAMRVSGCAYAAQSLEEAKLLAKRVTEVTHNHPEGLKGAEATTVATYLALRGISKEEIYQYITQHYYALNFTLDDIREEYSFDVSCQGSVPQALQAFFEATDFEDAIRNAISLGGDSDTIGAITGAIAGAYYGIPKTIGENTLSFLDKRIVDVLSRFEEKYVNRNF